MMLPFFLFFLFLAHLVSGADVQNGTKLDTGDSSSLSSPLPVLKMLPQGSVLEGLSIPRYDVNNAPHSLFLAKKLTVIDAQRLCIEDLDLSLYDAINQDVSLQAQAKEAFYNQKTSLFLVRERVDVQSDQSFLHAQGLFFDWHSQEGYLLGRVRSSLERHDALLQRQRAQALLFLYSPALLQASYPIEEALSQEDIEQLEQAGAPVGGLSEQRESIVSGFSLLDDLVMRYEEQVVAFLKRVGSDSVALIANGSDSVVREEEKEGTRIDITCAGGLYFDVDEGVLVYLKDIELTEERFIMQCKDQLKVFLEKKATKSVKQRLPSHKKGTNTLSINASFGAPRLIVATGKVVLRGKDATGKPFFAMAEKASYDAQKGEVILRGGRPRLQQSSNQYLEADESGQWIKILTNGKLLTSQGKWRMHIVSPRRKNQ